MTQIAPKRKDRTQPNRAMKKLLEGKPEAREAWAKADDELRKLCNSWASADEESRRAFIRFMDQYGPSAFLDIMAS